MIQRVLSLSLLVILVSSCICFKEQEMVLRYDPDADVLRIFQVYRGIYADSGEDAPNKNERNQLQSLFDSEQTYFFANWIFEYDRADLEDLVARLSELKAKKNSCISQLPMTSKQMSGIDYSRVCC